MKLYPFEYIERIDDSRARLMSHITGLEVASFELFCAHVDSLNWDYRHGVRSTDHPDGISSERYNKCLARILKSHLTGPVDLPLPE